MTTMTTQQLATRMVEMCRQGQIIEAQEELYGDEVTSIEPPHAPAPPAIGKAAVLAKGKYFVSTIEERHDGHFGDPIVCGNYFAITCMLDATYVGQGRRKLEEIGVYGVKDGKIISEQFFY
jgi:hypothetical protein